MSEYRYALSRGPWLNGEGTVLFVMLNPSTADEREDDPTIRRCIGFAQSWGFARLTVGNLYGLRATDPRALLVADDAVGRENDAALTKLAKNATEIIVAWGATRHPFPKRARDVLWLLGRHCRAVYCVGETKDGQPRHPLYARRDAERFVYRGEVAA